jgi:hypothetical protein
MKVGGTKRLLTFCGGGDRFVVSVRLCRCRSISSREAGYLVVKVLGSLLEKAPALSV